MCSIFGASLPGDNGCTMLEPAGLVNFPLDAKLSTHLLDDPTVAVPYRCSSIVDTVLPGPLPLNGL